MVAYYGTRKAGFDVITQILKDLFTVNNHFFTVFRLILILRRYMLGFLTGGLDNKETALQQSSLGKVFRLRES